MASDEQAALLAQIQALSGAIDQRRSTESARGASSAATRGYHGRGGYHSSFSARRGRGNYYSQSQAKQQNAQLPSRHRTLVLSGKPASASENEENPVEGTSATDEAGQESWVKRKSTHNMSLVSSKTFEKTEPARLAAMAATQSAKEASKSAKADARTAKAVAKSRTKAKASIRRGDNMGEVIIDGVIFEFDESGTKLVKKADQSASQSINDEGAKEKEETQQSTESPSTTPLRTSVNGQQFIRTKTGNLISQALLDQRKENRRNSEKLKRLDQIGKEIAERQRLRGGSAPGGRGRGGSKMISVRKKTLCAHFNKTGQCKNGLSCPYKHDPSKLAICPRILRPNGCPLPSGTCPLSHEPKPERIPHCMHFLSTAGNCRNGESCVYVHPSADVHLTNESQICVDFSDFGWCQKGANCDQRHTWDCPEFLRKGKCDRRGCKLMHVVRVSNIGHDGKSGTRQLDDDDLFVRDDDAHLHGMNPSEEEQVDGVNVDENGNQMGKRKRGGRIHEQELEEDGSSDDEDEPGLTFKSKKTKVFNGQDDFISFADMDDEEDEQEAEHQQDERESGLEDDEIEDDEGGNDSEIESVHSHIAEESSGEDEDAD